MHTRPNSLLRSCAVGAVLLLVPPLAGFPLLAPYLGGVAAADTQIVLETGSGRAVTLGGPVATLFVANPEIADVQTPANASSFFLFGKAPGRTTVIALSDQNKPLATWSVRVTQPIGDLKQRLAGAFPDTNLQVESSPAGVILTGTAPNAVVAQKAAEIATQVIGKDQTVINRIQVAAATQVNLRVRVAEVSRTVSKELGFNWSTAFNVGSFAFGIATGHALVDAAGNLARTATGAAALPVSYQSGNGRVDINAVVDALAQDGLISVLAEPNLTALSGETASFLAGGEFPIPIAQQDSTTTIQFKQFGVSLDFTPTVLSADRISIKVRPEVSELSDNGAININGLKIPALTVRRAETTVELGSGQSFAIAGLLQNGTQTNVDKVPGLGDVPVLGTLFRSSKFKRNETELVIVVTPYMVRPVSQTAQVKAPTDNFVPASDIERIFMGRVNTPGTAAPAQPVGPGGVRLRGDAGFMLE